MSNFPALDVAIGLSFLYFVLSLVCSALNESLAAITARRAKFLKKGLQTILQGPNGSTKALDQLWSHPLVKNMIRPAGTTKILRRTRKARYPSYLPSRTFATALLDLGEVTKGRGPTVEESVDAIENPEVQKALRALWRAGEPEFDAFRHRVEQWYDDAMERVSGWYRRRVQLWLWVFSILVAFLINADSLQIGNTLWTQPATRAQVVKVAEQAAQQGENGKKATERLKDLEATGLPLGWHFGKGSSKDPRRIPPLFHLAFFVKLLGLAITAVALTLGAPFWFDFLSRIARIRASGAPPPATDSVRHGEGEQTRAGSGATATA